MNINTSAVRKCLKSFDFATLFRELLGWDNLQAQLSISIGDDTFDLEAISQKRGFVAFLCPSIPDRSLRMKIYRQVKKSYHEHFIIYIDNAAGKQIWQWVRKEQGKPSANREEKFDVSQTGDPLIQKLERIAVSFEEEDGFDLPGAISRVRAAFDVDKVTKKFYDRFKKEHESFLKLITGIQAVADLQWYTSLMLNRLMFVYFIQKKGFLDGDTDYLKNRLEKVKMARGDGQFLSFYRYFLLRLFHDGLGKSLEERELDPAMEQLLGNVPFLNGGFFEVHPLEEHNPNIDIPDEAFEKLFNFFDQYSWHLDERPLRADNEINPDVVGYIFEKYINQKQMGAYYTKEDITEYISKNTILPFILEAAKKECAIAFDPESSLWRLLQEDPEQYIYRAVKHGVIQKDNSVLPEEELPDFVQTGMHDPKARMFDKRYNLQQAQKDDPIRLVTETWREYVIRRKRCLEIREKMLKGEVNQINDLITLNLDIWEFASDVIVNSEGPELLRALWKNIEKVTVLDPTCGSGAFLFAALRILETLYSDCLERMRRFVEELDENSPPLKFSDFKNVLAQNATHPNEKYFILKSIIINNLFGVDIMEEAVEICKLRLFLKLVAQVEKPEQIEPLPDIDFNIRAGNTLVGYTALEQIRTTQEDTFGFSIGEIEKIEEEAEFVERAFSQFRDQQTTHGGRITHEDKQALRSRLDKLDAKLDQFLAGEYGVDPKKLEDYKAWRETHQPFHWLVKFYGIMKAGGFDVIIGNPPYVEYSKVKKTYTIRGYQTEKCGNLYAYVLERCFALSTSPSFAGMIIPLSIATTKRMSSLQELIVKSPRYFYLSHFDVYPCRLFDGAKQRLTILIAGKRNPISEIYSTRYNRWGPLERDNLVSNLQYKKTSFIQRLNSLPKSACEMSGIVLSKLLHGSPVEFSIASNQTPIYVHRIPYNYIKALDFVPFFWNEIDGEKKSEDYKPYYLSNEVEELALLSALNSNLFFWWWHTLFEGYHCGRHEIFAFPADLDKLAPDITSLLESLVLQLMKDLKEKSKRKRCSYKRTGLVIYDEFYPRLSKPIIDEIDCVLAKHYGFTDEELDFIINYDIKYRMGADSEE